MSSMLQGRRWLFPVTVLGLGALGLTAWLGEVLTRGWEGLRWLQGFQLASVPGVFSAAFCVLLPVLRRTPVSKVRGALLVFSAASVSLFCFALARNALYALHSRSAAMALLMGTPEQASQFVRHQYLLLGLAALVGAVGFTVFLRRFTMPISFWSAGLFLAALLLVLPMSVLTIWLVPALNGSTDYLHAVKMGYPVFWTHVLLAAASEMAVRIHSARDRAPPT